MITPSLTAVILPVLRDLLLILFLALGSAWFALDIIRRLRKNPEPAAVAPTTPEPTPQSALPSTVIASSPPPSPATTPVTSPDGISADHLSVIAATVHHLFRGRGRIAGVSRASSPDSRWAHEGRRDIFSSHRIR